MPAREWLRALQAPVLPISVSPAVVGSLLGALTAGSFDLPIFALVTASLAAIQMGANLQKGLVESADLPQAPRKPASGFVFDAGAVLRLGHGRKTMERLTLALYASGAALGLMVVLLRRDPLLLVLGAAGAFVAFSYSGPPLKLSYRGVGEIATFLAFGPLMLVGASYAQTPAVSSSAIWLGVAFGFFAAAISYARYFPAEEEDRAKGKRTPVVRLGRRRAAAALVIFFGGGAVALGLGGVSLFNQFGIPALSIALIIVASGVAANRAIYYIRDPTPAFASLGVAFTVACHYLMSSLTAVVLLAAHLRVH